MAVREKELSTAQESNFESKLKSIVIKEHVLDHYDLVYAALSKVESLAPLLQSTNWEDKERELHSLCQPLREGSLDDEDSCSKFELEKSWGMRSEQSDILWIVLNSLGSVTVKEGVAFLRVAELAQILYISLVVKDLVMLKNKEHKVEAREGAFGLHSSHSEHDTQSKVHLISEHFDSLLRLILGVPPTCMSSSLVVTSADIDSLSVWLQPKQNSDKFKLSELSPFFVSHLHASFKDVRDWLKVAVGVGQEAKTSHILRANKQVIVRDRGEEKAQAQTCMKIADCTDSTIYCLFPVEFLLVRNCRNCKIVVGCAKFAQTLQCSELEVITACQTKLISSCNDCTFFLGTNECPILIGDNRNVTLAPYNTYYDNLEQHLEHFQISAQVNYWNLPKVIDSPYADPDDEQNRAFVVMPPEKWNKFVIPFVRDASGGKSLKQGVGASAVLQEGREARPFAAPKGYQEALAAVDSKVENIRQKVASANLGEGQRQELQRAIQARFKDWLMVTNSLSEIQALTRMEAHHQQ